MRIRYLSLVVPAAVLLGMAMGCEDDDHDHWRHRDDRVVIRELERREPVVVREEPVRREPVYRDERIDRDGDRR